MSEITLSQLENQEPQNQGDLEQEFVGIQSDLGTTRLMMNLLRKQEQELITRRSWIRTQLRLLRAPMEPRRSLASESSSASATTEPYCPDCSEEDL